MSYIKNIEHESVLELMNQVDIQPGQIVSKTLVQNKAIGITLFAFSKGEEISTHASSGDAMVSVLEGSGHFKVEDKKYICSRGETLIMPANKPHSIYAEEDFKMMLTVVFPTN